MKSQILSKNGLKPINLNRRTAIRERCLNCSGWQPKEVKECSLAECPLFPFRLGGGKQNPKDRSKAIRGYCLWCMNGQPGEVNKCPSKECPLFGFRKG
jgi:hypothetical protein